MKVIHCDHNGVTVLTAESTDDIVKPAHFYRVDHGEGATVLGFQDGPVKVHGVNGITNESLLAILIDRTRILNSEFPCAENEAALVGMMAAQAAFESRTNARIARGVEGQNLA